MLEYLVRPYQTPNSRGQIIIPATPSAPSEKATLTWGASSTKTPSGNIGFTVKCCTVNNTETDRTSDLVRIDGNDGESYIYVRRARNLKLNRTEKNTCSDDWDQFSGVGAEITGALEEFAAEMVPSGSTSTECGQEWILDNNTSAG